MKFVMFALRPLLMLLAVLLILLCCAPTHAQAGPILRLIRAMRQARAERLAEAHAVASVSFSPQATTVGYVPFEQTNLVNQVSSLPVSWTQTRSMPSPATYSLNLAAEQYVTVPSEQVNYQVQAQPTQYVFTAPPRSQAFYYSSAAFGDCPGGVCVGGNCAPPARFGLFGRRGW